MLSVLQLVFMLLCADTQTQFTFLKHRNDILGLNAKKHMGLYA